MVVRLCVIIHIPLLIYIPLCNRNETRIMIAPELISMSVLSMITPIILIYTIPLRPKLEVVAVQESSENVSHFVELRTKIHYDLTTLLVTNVSSETIVQFNSTTGCQIAHLGMPAVFMSGLGNLLSSMR